ncbi:hypothetical protein DFJ77DRAFT_436592 [Powellomyces hirtus]|nr:hypothetical protein DFJ77DRAFT_436592 [Powellomyces hirtus]
MRPDAHKAKATKKWKAKNGVPSPAPAAPNPKHDKRQEISQQPRPAEQESTTEDHEGEPPAEKPRSKYARRKVESNAYRYHELTAEEILAADAGIDRETEGLRSLIREAEEEYDPNLYFQFKEERDWADVATSDADTGLDEINFKALEATLRTLPVHVRLNISKDETTAVPDPKSDAAEWLNTSFEDELPPPPVISEPETLPTAHLLGPPQECQRATEDASHRFPPSTDMQVADAVQSRVTLPPPVTQQPSPPKPAAYPTNNTASISKPQHE